MKILSIHVSSFGKLQNVDINFADGVNILAQKNGFGKTTLAAFIRAMLYGFKYTSARSSIKKRAESASRWLTWNSTQKIGGSMKVVHAGETILIERYFGAKSDRESLTVLNQNTGKPLDLQNSVGETLLGLTAESFDRSAYFPQESVELSSNENFDTRLAGLVQNAEDFSKVMASLNEQRKKLQLQKGNGGLIFELETQKMQLLQRLNDCEAAQKRQKEIELSLAEIARQKAETDKSLSALNAQAENLQNQLAQAQPTATQRENAAKLQQLQQKTQRLENLPKDYETCNRIAEKVQNTPEITKVQRPVSRVLLAIGIVLLAAGVGLCFWKLIVGLCCAAVGAICTVLAFFVRPALKTLQSGERDSYISEYFSVASQYVFCKDLSYAEVQKKMWQLYTDYVADCRERDALSQMSVKPTQNTDEISKKLAQTKELWSSEQLQLQNLSRKEGALVTERDALNTDSVPVIEKLEETRRQIENAKKRLNTVQKVAELLTQAKENLSTSYLPTLASRCGNLLNAITAGRYQVVLDRDFSIQLNQNGVTKPLDFFSRGLREITLLCFRVALSEMLFGGKIPLLIIDDAFVNFDEENFLRATSLLKKISAQTQVLYFTCHNRLGALK